MGLEYKNDINPTGSDRGIECPLVEFAIEKSNCMENTMVVAGFMNEFGMHEKFKTKENWREICRNCRYFNF